MISPSCFGTIRPANELLKEASDKIARDYRKEFVTTEEEKGEILTIKISVGDKGTERTSLSYSCYLTV